MSSVPITKHGAEMLKEELHRLKTKDRPSVINAIAEARAQGDLSENAEYDAAKERRSFIEGRMLASGSRRQDGCSANYRPDSTSMPMVA